ncbi:MAG: PqqD family protein [Candidatus Hodarchaeales archaeon]|jgi:hypothetical protein
MQKIRKQSSGLTVSAKDLLKITPIQNPLVEVKQYDSGEIGLVLKTVPTKKRSFISKIFPIPTGRKIVLDEMGTHFWKLCDSRNRIKDIVVEFQKEYNMSELEARISISLFVENLSKRQLVGFILPHSLRQKHSRNTKEFEKLTIDDLPKGVKK